MYQLPAITILLLVLLNSVVHAFVSQPADSSYTVDWHISAYFEDPGQQLALADILSNNSMTSWPQSKTTPGFGFSKSAYWLKIDIHNPGTHSINNVWSVGIPWLDEIDLFLVAKGQVLKQWQLGDQRPYNPAYYKSLNPNIAMNFPPGKSLLYLRVATVEAMMVPINIVTPEEWLNKEIQTAYYFGVVYGSLALIAIYNLFLFLSLKTRAYLYYVLFLAAFMLASASYNGILYQLFFTQQPDIATKIHPHLFFLYQYAGLLFVAEFLKTRTRYPGLHRLFTVFAGLMLILQLVISLFDTPYFSQSISVMSASIYGFILVGTGIYIFRSLGLASMLLTFGIFSSVIGTIIATLTVFAVIPFRFFLFHSIEIGFIIDAALLSFALAANMKLLTREKQKMQAALLEKESQKKHELEQLVKQRTDKLAQANQQLKQLALTDELTQLLNRMGVNQHLLDNLSLFQRYRKIFSIIMLDIDYFKKINDQYGHQTGDQVLQEFARLLQEHTRNCDICCRWGGEEFIIICPETTQEGAIQLAQNIQSKITATYLVKDISVTCSIGIASLTADDDQDNLVKRADQHLYRAKQQGRNMICY